MEWHSQGKIKVLGEKSVALSLSSPHVTSTTTISGLCCRMSGNTATDMAISLSFSVKQRNNEHTVNEMLSEIFTERGFTRRFK